MTEKELIIKNGDKLDKQLCEAKKTGNLVVQNATEDEKTIRKNIRGRERSF